MAVQLRQRDDSGKPIQLVYVRTARFVYPDLYPLSPLEVSPSQNC